MSIDRIRVAHIVPSMYIGGVEIAIQRSFARLNEAFDYRIFWVKRRGTLPVPAQHVLCVLGSALSQRWRPDVVVTSLWYAHPFGWLMRLFGCRWVAFFHNSGFSHVIDGAVQRWAWRHADRLLVDSGATLNAMQAFAQRDAQAVSYIFEQTPVDPNGARDIGLLWVGRSVSEKRIDLFVEMVRATKAWDPGMQCVAVVAGEPPDCLLEAATDPALRLKILCNQTNEQVRRLLARAKYYVLTSDYEGMSMTTIEAVQCGCVPVVRPVGEIGRYLDTDSAVFIKEGTTDAVLAASVQLSEIDGHGNELGRRSARALDGVSRLGTYVDSFSCGLHAARASVRR